MDNEPDNFDSYQQQTAEDGLGIPLTGTAGILIKAVRIGAIDLRKANIVYTWSSVRQDFLLQVGYFLKFRIFMNQYRIQLQCRCGYPGICQ